MKAGQYEHHSRRGRVSRRSRIGPPCRRGQLGRYGDDTGQGAIDYIGAIVVITAVVVALLGTGVAPSLADGFKAAVCRVTGGDCENPEVQAGGDSKKTDEDMKPGWCDSSTKSDTSGGEVKFGIFKFGNEYNFTEQVYKTKDGGEKVMLTFNDSREAGVGVSAPGIKLGKGKTREHEIAGGVKIGVGETYVFNSQEKADEFRDKLWQLEFSKQNTVLSPDGTPLGVAAYQEDKEEMQKIIDEGNAGKGQNDKDRIGKIDTTTRSLDAGGDLSLNGDGKSKGKHAKEKQLEKQFGASVSLKDEVTVTKNNSTDPPLVQETYKIEGEGVGKADVGKSKGGAEGKITAAAGKKFTGTITVSRTKDGELRRIDMTRAIETSGKVGAEGKGSKDSKSGGKHAKPKKNSGKGGASDKDSTVETTTNSIYFDDKTFEDPSELKSARDIAEKQLDTGLTATTSNGPWDYMFNGPESLQQRPDKDDEFGQLLFDNAISSRTEHEKTTDGWDIGGEIHLGLTLGANFGYESMGSEIGEAEFLGAPRGDSRSYKPYEYCAK